MQYTVRNIPEKLDQELRRRRQGLGHRGEAVRYRDLSGIAGTWKDDPEFDEAIVDQDTIDPDLWAQ